MDSYVYISFIRNNIGGNGILSKYYLLYGMGKTNLAIKEFFDKNSVKYRVYVDNDKDYEDITIKDVDYIVKSPGIEFNTPLLEAATLSNIPIISDLELFYFLNSSNEFVIITGTNGKTTTSHLSYQMLEFLSYFKGGLGGNIGIPLFSLLKEKRSKRGFVIEASSFTLHNTYTLKPNVYVITNLVPHHLDYHDSKENYFSDKTKLIDNMDTFDYLIYNKDDQQIEKLVLDKHNNIKISFSLFDKNADIYYDDSAIIYKKEKFIEAKDLKIKEQTVIIDMMIAILIAKIYHIPNKHIKEVLKQFEGLPYRFEKIYDKDELVIYNDSKSTSPAALFVAINSIIENYPSFSKFLIMGGRMVDEDYREINNLINSINEIYLYGESRHELAKKLNHQNLKLFESLDEVIEDITLLKRQVILFSPSCVSYDQFESFEKRGKKFNILIENKLKM